MSVIRAFFGAIGAFFGSVFGAVLSFIILIAGSIFLFAYLDNKEDLQYYDDRPPRAVVERDPAEYELLQAIEEALANKEADEEDAAQPPDLAMEETGSSELYGPPWQPWLVPGWVEPVDMLDGRQKVVRDGSDIRGRRQSTPSETLEDGGDETQSPPESLQEPGGPDGGTQESDSPNTDTPYPDGISLEAIEGVELNSASIDGDPTLKAMNIAADERYQADLDAISKHLIESGEIPDSALDSLRETLGMYEATTRAAYTSDLMTDNQAVYARIKAVQIRRFLGIPV